MHRLPGTLLLVASLLVLSGSPLQAQENDYASWDELLETFDQDPLYKEWAQALSDYASDPVGGGPALLQLSEQRSLDGIPSLGLVIVGDAYLRNGDLTNARRHFEAFVEESPDPLQGPGEFGAYAYLGLGMVEARRGRLDDARAAFAQAGKSPEALGYFATLLEAQTASAEGDFEHSLEVLDALSVAAQDAKNSQPGVVRAAQVARANTLMAAGEYDEAVAAFAALEKAGGEGLTVDERYAAAQARLRAGDESGVEALTALVESCPPEDESAKSASRRMRNLEPRAVLLRWLENYSELPFFSFSSDSAPIYSIDGCRLAVLTVERNEASVVRRVARAEEVVPAPAPEVPVAAAPQIEEEAPSTSAPKQASSSESATPTERSMPWVALLIGALVLGGIVLWMRR